MKYVSIKVDTGQLRQAEEALRKIPGGAEQAVRSALFRARQHLWTQSRREVRKKYDISDADLRAERLARMTYRYSPGVGIEAGVDFMGNKIPLHKFTGSAPRERVDQNKTVLVNAYGAMRFVHPSIAAKAHQYRGTAATTFPHAFVVKMPNAKGKDHWGIFERDKGKTRLDPNLPIHELKGDAFSQMVGEQSVREELTKGAISTMEERLNHEIERILAGYGMK